MRKEGLEPPYPFGYQILSLARLPVPPLSRAGSVTRSAEPAPSKQTSRGQRAKAGAWRKRCATIAGQWQVPTPSSDSSNFVLTHMGNRASPRFPHGLEQSLIH